jgi:cytochrome c oxidase cbb3-type subunit 3
MTIGFGRHGTPMGAFRDDMGGPMSEDEVYQLATWLKEQSGHKPIELPEDPIPGDVAMGKEVYEINCSVCHGDNGEGDVGPAIGNPAMLSNASDAFLRYAIENGRDGTEMPSFKEDLTAQEIDNVTAFLRSRVAGWEKERPVLRTPPTVDEYILNPGSPAPEFNLKDGAYVMAAELDQALREKRRMVLLDTRVTSMWQMAHIEGSIPIPYYYEYFDDLSKEPRAQGKGIQEYRRAVGRNPGMGCAGFPGRTRADRQGF